jgi:hypothetical protein
MCAFRRAHALSVCVCFSALFCAPRLSAALFKALVRQRQLGSPKTAAPGAPARLLFAGGGVGGRGALFTLDAVAPMLADAGVLPGAVTVAGLLDAPLLLQVGPASSGVTALTAQTQAAYALLNVSDALLGETCLDATSTANAWMCLFRARPLHACVRTCAMCARCMC